MHFDDRLGTVLRLSATGGAMQRVQYRQLLDLLGTSPAEARGTQLDAAYDRLAELAGKIPSAERAAMIRDAGLRLRSPRLAAALSGGEPPVAAAALQNVQLGSEQWRDLVPALPPSARPYLRERRDLAPEVLALLGRLGINDRGLPPASAAASAAVLVIGPDGEGDILAPQAGQDEGAIGAIVKRIEAFRRSRLVVNHSPSNDSPRLPLGEEHVLQVPETVRAFDFATDAEARICWADPGVAPMVLGLRLDLTGESAASMRRHQPLRGPMLHIDGAPAIAGQWRLDAAPWFNPLTGSFIGYRGRMRRPADPAPALDPVTDSEADRIRQMLHELRTPVNAIQVGAEMIQQQLYGPTPHDYRALAAGIAGDAARMLSAFEELERLARLDSGAMELERGETDLGEVVQATVAQLGAHTAQRGSGFTLRADPERLQVPLERLEVERIAWRLLATLAGVSAPGEVLKLRLRRRGALARLDLALPAILAAKDDDALFKAAAGAIPQVIAAGVFGVGFALRLARTEARAAGGDLVRKEGKLRLTLPGLTRQVSNHTDGNAQAAAGAERV